MSKPKKKFQVNYFYLDKYNNEKLIQKRKPVPPNIACMMYIRNNVRYMTVIRIVGFKFYSAECREKELLCSNLLVFRDIKMQDPTKFCIHHECCCDSEKYENAVILLSI